MQLQKRTCKPTAISMRFIPATRRDWISTYKNGNFEQQFRYRAGALSLKTKWVVKSAFYSRNVLLFVLLLWTTRKCNTWMLRKTLSPVFSEDKSLSLQFQHTSESPLATSFRGFSEFPPSLSSFVARPTCNYCASAVAIILPKLS